MTGVKRFLCFKRSLKNDSALQFYRKVPSEIFPLVSSVQSLQHVYYPAKKRTNPKTNLNVKTSQNNVTDKIQGSILIPETLKHPSHYTRMFQVKDLKKGDLLNHHFQISLTCLGGIKITIDKYI